MLLMHRLIISLLTLSVLAGCGHTSKSDVKAIPKSTYHKAFSYPFEAVWRAAQLSLKYPIAINNMDNGLLETEWVRGDEGYVAPASKPPSPGVRFKIQIHMVKGKIDGGSSVRVSITKKLEKQKDFFSDVEKLVSDGLEEKVLFYRMEREIIIDEALKKAAARGL